MAASAQENEDGSAAAAAEDFIACHRLASALLPAHRLRALLAHAGTAAQALHLSDAALAAPPVGLTGKQITRLRDAVRETLPARLVEQTRQLGVRVVSFRDPDYPANLSLLSDSPALLFVRGALLSDDRFSVAIVGSRRATLYGRGQADRFARAFADRGLAVVSGGAAGIDTAAHRGVLGAGGRTIAVLGCGVDVIYPAENKTLFEQIIASGGAVVSEFPMGTRPEPWRFPTRNRIIAGMTRTTVVIETPADSGALITARDAAQYGRDVWVIPGPVDSGRSRGGHQLIQDGAALADTPDDVLFALGLAAADAMPATTAKPIPKDLRSPAAAEASSSPAAPPPPLPAVLPNLTPDEQALLAQFDLSPRHLDEAGSGASLTAAQATVAATLLEMKALIRRQPGNLFVRAL